ncbi:carbohydrate ABC transporter permease [Actinopolymorpha singaporensis]|uniref:Multiple sugar transport system permease protein n=1 Tax=Actinopolymorpha singaporensis TaxID=117157 RepID=A0A1H1YR19_9ACTN|nr:sugar ABC transporter permease [Actinopolymorpha singaporensis]SDT23790.1 multiple sugar transport system permease protein [Actinopolymorpha singaporensis]
MTGERVIPGAAGSGQNPQNPAGAQGAAPTAVTDSPGAGTPQGAQGTSTAATPRLSRRRRLEGALFVTPAFLFQLSWGWYPLLMAFVISFTNARFRGPVEFTGLTSYLRMWRDPLVGEAFKVTAIYTVLSIGLTFMIPVVVAILLMEMPRRHIRWMMLLWFLPLSGIASTLLFRYMFNAQYGLFQWVATEVLHLSPQPFLNSGNQVLFWLVFPGILFFGPGLIYMATLQGIPASYYEAAEIEGAGFWRKIWTISLPRLRPVISMLLIFAVIGSSQAFEFPLIMTGGGPGGASRTVVMYLYELMRSLRYADATALGVFLFVVTMVLVVIQRRFFREDPDQ